ncbi:hypothetical protein [Amycolatopsis sp. NBC_01286]|uniref:hypothetical protein n=1 Tax=Amycolatopsis sp. NBC_01286 TaxID=2903560 RepID=UPI002E13C541|nr:hypothetical protein OG570_26425 [Amycolatopsis sp. NBC_01286]
MTTGVFAVPAGLDAARPVALVYRVARRTGASRRAARRLCVRLLPVVPGEPVADVASARRIRVLVVRALRTELAPRCDAALLEAAVADAVLLDEVALLPPRQRFVVREMALERRSLAEVAATTGWTRAQVMRLLNAGLSSITTRVHIGHLPRQASTT